MPSFNLVTRWLSPVLAKALLLYFVTYACSSSQIVPKSSPPPDNQVRPKLGGNLVVALRSEPKTLNPILSVDVISREVIGAMHADLIHINRESQRTEPALASRWDVSLDRRRYTIHLRNGVRFSDGATVNADDVVFSFQLYLDPNLHSPQRDLLLVDGQQVDVKKIDDSTVEFAFPKPYAAAERLFDGLAILPRHLLWKPYQEGRLAQIGAPASWTPGQMPGLGPFRFKEYVAGQKLVLERNPYYWKFDQLGNRLPYLQTVTFLFVANEDSQVLRFLASEADLLERVSPASFDAIKGNHGRSVCTKDLGPGLESVFLLFNLNSPGPPSLPSLSAKQTWFRDDNFRSAISAAADRESIARVAYNGHAAPLWGHVTLGNRRWFDANLPHRERSIADARALLARSGFIWNADGSLADASGHPVEFTIITSSSSPERSKLATLLQEDLRLLGVKVSIVPLEFRSMVDRVLNSKEYEAALMNFASGDSDPTSEMNVWLSKGSTHLWNLAETSPLSPWQTEIDRLMTQQATAPNDEQRKVQYDRVQELVAAHVPMVFLVSPHVLIAAGDSIANLRPGVLYPYVLWNADELYLEGEGRRTCP